MTSLNMPKRPFVALLMVSMVGSFASAQECNDEIPTECDSVRPVGEMEGCACFVCNPDSSREAVVCTRDEGDKERLRSLPHR